jgi:hypothetical protein
MLKLAPFGRDPDFPEVGAYVFGDRTLRPNDEIF